ncbi:MAG TPA: c-type cytochrome [Candidatus Polarisedimenticolia bacterium]|nr:c-type cytochrome [Candidatus Polarisedimenticolia bacterium]
MSRGGLMKRFLKGIGLAVAVVLAVAAGAAVYVALAPSPHYPTRKVEFTVDVTPERVARGRRSVEMLCASCHLDSQTGALTGRRMPDLPAEFGEAFSLNITSHPSKGIGGWTDGEIAYLLRTGVARDGRYTPPWMIKLPHISDEDLRDIIAFLRSDDPLVQARDVDNRPSRPSFLAKLLCRVDFKPFAYPRQEIAGPAPGDEVAYGRYLVDSKLLCYGCHSADFKTLDEEHPQNSPGYLAGGNPMPEAGGTVVRTANLTPDDDTGLGRWTGADFRRALVEGIRPDNRPLRFPMVPYRSLTDEEVGAIYAYLRTVPPARNAVARAETLVVEGDRGKQVYYSYGCNSCHGDSGQGQYDLRKGPENYPSDEALIAWIKHPERVRPGIAMPTWDGVIKEEEYAPLAAYVRSLAGAAVSR